MPNYLSYISPCCHVLNPIPISDLIMKPMETITISKSKNRVVRYAEVLTPPHIVDLMLNLVDHETRRIESRFLEPACGTGNFLIEVLNRKLYVVKKNYARVQLEFERYAILAVSSLYGIDLLKDNIECCRHRLFSLFNKMYTELFKEKAKAACRDAVHYLLSKNIVQGDAITMKTIEEPKQNIVFPEWSLVRINQIKRRDFAFNELIDHGYIREMPLFSDLSEEVFIPKPVKEYQPVYFLDIAHAYDD